MNLKYLTAALLMASLAMPVNAASVMPSAFLGMERQSDALIVASKRKKKKKQQVRRNPRNGDVLIGRVDGFNKQDWRTAHRAREGDDLGGLLGQAVNNFMGGRVYSNGRGGRRTGAHERPMGTAGQNCGPQYWTANPTSPTC